jgi:hypothetical protein
VSAGASFRPSDLPVLEDECGPRGADGVDGRGHDRLERLLQVERLGNGLGDTRKRLELGNASLSLAVELGVLDRLRDLVGDRDEEFDLVLCELARRDRADVERAGKLLAGEDRNGARRRRCR